MRYREACVELARASVYVPPQIFNLVCTAERALRNMEPTISTEGRELNVNQTLHERPNEFETDLIYQAEESLRQLHLYFAPAPDNLPPFGHDYGANRRRYEEMLDYLCCNGAPVYFFLTLKPYRVDMRFRPRENLNLVPVTYKFKVRLSFFAIQVLSTY